MEFLKSQLKQGDEIAVGWAYMGLLTPRDPRNFSIFTKFKPYSLELKKELETNAVELLRLIAKRNKADSFDYLLGFIVDNLLEDPTSDDTIVAIRQVLVKFGPKELLTAANKVPKRVLNKEVFSSVKSRLFAVETKWGRTR